MKEIENFQFFPSCILALVALYITHEGWDFQFFPSCIKESFSLMS
ncbi:MAG: hypothetical protein NZ954_08725 [Thermofilaceae archaeon]|nr:hypothetical protein [Thermofilaceae archaeon]